MDLYILVLIVAVPILLIIGHVLFWVRFNRLAKDVRRIADALATKPPNKPVS